MRFLIILLLGGLTQTNPPKITEIQDSETKELMGSLLSGDRYLVNEFSLRIHQKENSYGSAGNDSGEITHSYFFVISDNDDFPRESVFEIGEFYGPNVKAVREKENLIEVDIEYYTNLKKTTKTIFVRHHQVSF